MNRPGSRLTLDVWDLLTTGHPADVSHHKFNQVNELNLLQARVEGGDVLHVQGKRWFLDSKPIQGLVVIPAVLAAVGYICQYAILKESSNRAALIWIGCQGGLALLRVAFWILDPEFDNQSGGKTECAYFNNTQFGKLSPMELICACSSKSDGTNIPQWVWKYLTDTDLNKLLLDATPEEIPPSEDGAKYYVLLDVDFERIIHNRLRKPPAWHKSDIWRLGFEKVAHGVRPFTVIQVRNYDKTVLSQRGKHQLTVSSSYQNPWVDGCWTKVALDSDDLFNQHSELINQPCIQWFFNQQGIRVHLLPFGDVKRCPEYCKHDTSWRDDTNFIYQEDAYSGMNIKNRAHNICSNIRAVVPQTRAQAESNSCLNSIAINGLGDVVWRITMAGTIDRSGYLCPKTVRTYGTGNNGEMESAMCEVGEYIKRGQEKIGEKDTVQSPNEAQSDQEDETV
jgi:hypothetical protein